MNYTYGASRTRLVLCPKCRTYRPVPHPCQPVENDEEDGDA